MSSLNNKKSQSAILLALVAFFGISSLIYASTNAKLALRVLINNREHGQDEYLGNINGAPEISIIPELAGPDQTMVVLGENLNALIDLQGGMLSNEEVAQPPSARPEPTNVLELTKPRFVERVLAPGEVIRKSLRFIIPSDWDQNGAYQIIARNLNQTGNNPAFWLNTPVLDWVKTTTKNTITRYTSSDMETKFSPTSPELVWSGSTLEIYGKNLSPVSGQAKAWLVPCPGQASAIMESCFDSGNAISLEFESSVSPYLSKFRIPSSVQPGVYSLWYHRGIGGIRGFNFSTALAVEVRAAETAWEWPCNVDIALAGTDPHCLDPKTFGAVGDGETWDTDAFLKTLLAAHTNGGATILISPGTYRIGNTLVIPPLTRIVGAGSSGSSLSKVYDTTLLFDMDRTYIRKLARADTPTPYWDGNKYYMGNVPNEATEGNTPDQYVWLNLTPAGGIIAQNDVAFEDIKIMSKAAPVMVEGHYGKTIESPYSVVTCPNPVTQTGKVNCRNIKLSNVQLLSNAQYSQFFAPDTFTPAQALEFKGNGLTITNSEILGHGSEVENGVCIGPLIGNHQLTRCIGSKSYSLWGNNIDIQDSYIEGYWSDMRKNSRVTIINNAIRGFNGSCTGGSEDFSRAYFGENTVGNCVDYHGGGAEAFTFDTPYRPYWMGKPASGSIGDKTLTVEQMFSTVNGKAFRQDGREWWQRCEPPLPYPCLPENLWNDSLMVIVSGKGLGQAVPIISNTYAPFSFHKNESVPTSNVTLAYPWTIKPDETSVMAIVPRKDKTVFYKNSFFNAKNSLQFYTDVYKSVVDGNTFEKTLGTIAHSQDWYDPEADPTKRESLPERRYAFSFLNTWLNNTYNLDYFPAAHGETYVVPNQNFGANYSGFSGVFRGMTTDWSGDSFLTSEPLGLAHLANIYRNNTFKGSESPDAANYDRVAIGVLFNETRGGSVTVCKRVSTAQIQARDTVIENNTIAGGLPANSASQKRALIEVDTASFGAIIRKNSCTSVNQLYCADGLLRDIGQGTAAFGAEKIIPPPAVVSDPNGYVCNPVGGKELWI